MSFFSIYERGTQMNVNEIQKILNMIYHKGRPLEEARVKHLLFGAPSEEVINQLAMFQNPDGGFGGSLEPDIWNPNSSPIQTWTAITILRELDFDKKHPVVLNMIRYLEESIDESQLRWYLTHPTNDDYPHAPWWEYREEPYTWNPTASIAGFLVKHAPPLSKAFKQSSKIVQEAFQFIIQTEAPIEMHELRCLIDLMMDAKDTFGRSEIYLKAEKAIISHMERILEKDSTKWFTEYCVKPSALIKEHPTFASQAFIDLLYLEFEEAKKHRNSDGIWDATWDWAGQYDSAFQEAKTIWQGIIAYEYLYLMVKTRYIQIPSES